MLTSYQIDGLLISSPTGNLLLLPLLFLCGSFFSLLFHVLLVLYPIIIPKINVKELFSLCFLEVAV